MRITTTPESVRATAVAGGNPPIPRLVDDDEAEDHGDNVLAGH
jgi:hypothetical protein